ncbi:MAG: zeta toxin family protein [Desulforhabdus sp.]|nr:zeta toxin family protein [Desulforhabdus sp.]
MGDVLLIDDKHRRAGEAIIQEILKSSQEKYVVAISGESGSGKSELAHVIARGLRNSGVVSKAISADNFYRVHPLERTEFRKKYGVETVVGPDEYDWGAIYQMLEDFRSGIVSNIPCVDLVTDHVDRLTTDFGPIQVLVVDGIYAIKTEGIDLRVFIDLTYHETKKAQVVRGKEPQNEFRMQVLEQEHRMVHALKPLADLVISREYEPVRQTPAAAAA